MIDIFAFKMAKTDLVIKTHEKSTFWIVIRLNYI